jgi:hypothetical protein
MADPTNAEIMAELQKLGGIVQRMDRRLKTVEADMALLRSAYANQGKTIGDLLRSTPIPPPLENDDDDDDDGDTNPSIDVPPEDLERQ